MGQVDCAEALGQILLVRPFDDAQMVLEGDDETFGQYGHSISCPLAVTDGDSAVVEIQVLDPQTQALHQPQAGAIEEPGHQQVQAR